MSYKPTDQMAKAAARGLEMRANSTPSNRGGTAVGLARAHQLKNKEGVSIDTVKRIYSFLSRHAKNYKPGENTPGTQAYLLWGGPSGLGWARKILRSEGLLNE